MKIFNHILNEILLISILYLINKLVMQRFDTKYFRLFPLDIILHCICPYLHYTLGGQKISDELIYHKDKIYKACYHIYPHGLFHSYPLNGDHILTEYKDGLLDGPKKSWYPGDNIKSIHLYVEGKEHGKQIGWFPNGNIEYIYRCNRGILDGISQGFYENGCLKFEHNYRLGLKDKLWRYWFDNKQLKQSCIYENGKIIRDRIWNDKGQLIRNIENRLQVYL